MDERNEHVTFEETHDPGCGGCGNSVEPNEEHSVVRRFWVSWVQPTRDHRPLRYPPHDPVLGWWLTGENSKGGATLVALIEAEDEKAAEMVIRNEWPEWAGWRFIEEQDADWTPNNYRFPLSDWMKPRISSANLRRIRPRQTIAELMQGLCASCAAGLPCRYENDEWIHDFSDDLNCRQICVASLIRDYLAGMLEDPEPADCRIVTRRPKGAK